MEIEPAQSAVCCALGAAAIFRRGMSWCRSSIASRYPVWGPKGSGELFYPDLNGGMMVASVELSPSLSLRRVTKLFDWEEPPHGTTARLYDMSPVDGRFLMTKPATAGSAGVINISVVLNWFEELRERVPLRTH